MLPEEPRLKDISACCPGDHFGYFTDFLKRLTLARQWVETHKSEYAAIWAKKANLDPTVSLHWISNADMTVGPVDLQAVRDFRETADFLYHTGTLPTAFDIHKVIDPSFTAAFKQ